MNPVPVAAGWAALAALALAVAAVALRPIAAELAVTPAAESPPLTGAWLSYLAADATCPGAGDASAPPLEQRRTMVCLINYARLARGLAPAVPVTPLRASARLKAQQIVACGRFGHDPCGTGADSVFRRVAYRSGYAQAAYSENLALMTADGASPRTILNAWLNSRDHRRNLFRPEWREQGVALLPNVSVGDERGVTVWVSQFGWRR